VLTKAKKDRPGYFDCYVWSSEGHDDREAVALYEYIDGFVTGGDQNEEAIINTLRKDKEWKETVENLKKFAESMLNQNLK